MRSVGFVFAATTALVAAVPVPASTDPSAPCASASVKNGQSTALGWQIVATSPSTSALSTTCDQISNNANFAWSRLGLTLSQVQEPICGSTTDTPSASDLLPQIVVANTQTMQTLFENAFAADDTDTYGYLCSNLGYDELSSFSINDMQIKNATCNLSSQPISPKSFGEGAGSHANPSAVAAYRDAQSNLYGYLYAAQASSSQDLSNLCQVAKSQAAQADYQTLEFDPACVSATVCGLQQPLDMEEGKRQVKKYTSLAFANVLTYSGTNAGYAQRVCQALDTQRLEAAGVDGELVRGVACGASS